MKQKLRRILFLVFWVANASAIAASPSAQDDDDKFWQQVYDARSLYYEKHIGQFPDNILKMGNMTGVWPGGGLFVISANKLGKGLWVYTTYGLTNPDMPASTMLTDLKVETDKQGRVISNSGTLQRKKRAHTSTGAAGYGYEMLLIAKEKAEWPLWFMQWSANAEILNDAGILHRVEKFNGLTVQDIKVGKTGSINVLIAKARSPLPTGTLLPNGKMDLLIATVITDDEMRWSIINGRDALLEKLIASGVGQISDRNRQSIFKK